MVEKHIIPESIDEFVYGTEYQVQDIYGKWGSNQIISKVCFSVKTDLLTLMELGRIRIVENDKSTR